MTEDTKAPEKTKSDLPELTFTEPRAERRVRALFTVKAFDKDGALVQVPLADQINNQVSSPESMVGLRLYERKGYKLLWDFDRGKGAYCPAGDCWAKWNDSFAGFCSAEHKAIMSKKDTPTGFEAGATTTHTAWRSE